MEDHELVATAEAIIDAGVYMTIATVGEDGRPWACPVFFAAGDYVDFYWMSSPKTQHSRNIAFRPDVSLIIFDSTAALGTGDAVAVTATAVEVPIDEIEQGLRVYPGSAGRGGRPVGVERVQAPSPFRLYRATASAHFVQCPWGDGACIAHGERFDHRIAVPIV
jgi:nitroimidazol reductase NimA-like FMN-containing flavoprotein (pyridoxamine 5'-phosphate oxidase superfamily)